MFVLPLALKSCSAVLKRYQRLLVSIVPVSIDLVATLDKHLKVTHASRDFRFKESLAISWASKFNLIRSSVIGTLVRTLPGAGGSIAGLVAYPEAQRSSLSL